MNIRVPIALLASRSEQNYGRPVVKHASSKSTTAEKFPKAGFALATSVLIAMAVSGCSNGYYGADDPQLTVQAAPAESTSTAPATPAPAETTPPTPDQIADLPEKAPVPTVSPNEVVKQAPEPEASPAPVPEPSPRQASEESIMVAEKPVSTVEKVEIVETPERIVERKETIETSEIVVDRTRVNKEAGIAVEQVEVIERTEKTVDTIEIDKATGTAVETIVKSEPVDRETEALTVVVESTPMAPDGPKDSARIFAGPGQVEPSDYSGYGVFAVRLDTPASDRDRLVMLCDAFVAALPVSNDPAQKPDMVTVWPVASTARADEFNVATGGRRCEGAVERYDSEGGQEAISESERTGWILDNTGPYLLAWSPPSDKGVSGASVLLVDLSAVTDPGNARDIMRHWSEDVERNDMLWSVEGWEPEELSRVINDWRGEFGPRSILLLGTAGG